MAPGGFTSETYGGYFAASAIGLYCYEYLLTLGTELRFVWRRRFSAGSLLFVVNRYAMLVSSLATIAQILPSWTCDAPVWLASVCNIVGGYAYMVFAALRMYALYGKNKAILFVVLTAGIISPLGQCFIMSVGEIRTSTPPGGLLALRWGVVRCHYEARRTSLLSQAGINGDMVDAWFYLALRTHSLLFEMLLLALTWNKTLTRSNLRLPGFRAPFTTVLLRDGTLYFMVIAVILGLNLGGTAAAMRSIVTPSSNKPTNSAIVTTLTLFSPLVDTITSICMSRFLLNLLAAAEGAFESEHCSSRWDTVMRFAKVETFGAPLRDTSECSSEDTLCADSIELLDMGDSNRV